MFVGAVVLTSKHKPFNKYAIRNALSGLLWGTGNLFLLFITTCRSSNKLPIISNWNRYLNICAIVFLGEKKTKRQLIFIALGSVLIIGGAVLLGMTKA